MDKGGLIVGKGHLIGVELRQDNGEHALLFVHLHRTSKEVKIVGQGTVNSWQELKKECGDRVPISLCINDNGVLIRRLSANQPGKGLMQQAFPDIRAEEFCSTEYSAEGSAGIGIMRRERLEEILAETQEVGLRITSLYCGPWSLASLHDFLGDDMPWDAMNPKSLDGLDQEPLAIGDDQIGAGRVLAFASAWNTLLGSNTAQTDCGTLLNGNTKEERSRLFYEKGLAIAAGVLGFVFLGHLIFSTVIDRQEGVVNADLQVHREQVRQVEQMKIAKQNKLKLLGTFGMENDRSLTLESWEILRSVPAGIQLDLLDINPTSEIEADKEIITENGIIRIEGVCENPSIVNDWLVELNTNTLFSEARLLSYIAGRNSPAFIIQLRT